MQAGKFLPRHAGAYSSGSRGPGGHAVLTFTARVYTRATTRIPILFVSLFDFVS